MTFLKSHGLTGKQACFWNEADSHTYAGIQLRNACAEIMQRQGYEEPAGQAKITSGYNLPCKYVLCPDNFSFHSTSEGIVRLSCDPYGYMIDMEKGMPYLT